MSELTKCNFCNLAMMRARAEARGTTVVVKLETSGTMVDWTSARYADEDEPSAYFLKLTDECVC